MDDGASEVRSDRTGSVLEHSQPATDLTERVLHGITDVEPEELTAVVVRIVVEGGSGDVRANLLNCFLIHIGVEDERCLVRSDIVGGIVIPAQTLVRACGHERIDLRPSTADQNSRAVVARGAVGEAGNLHIDEVVVALEATIHTEGSDKLAGRSIADVLSEIAVVTEELTAGFGGGNESEDRRTILLTKSVVSSTITDEDDTKLIELILRELVSRGGEANRSAIDAVVQIATTCGGGDAGVAVEGVLRVVAALDLIGDLEVGRTTTVIKNSLGELGELLDGLGNLGLNLEGGLQIVQADARGLVALGLEVPSTIGLTEGQIRRGRNATIGDIAIGDAITRSANICPAVFKAAGKDSLNRDFGQGSTHSLREFANASETTPRAVDGVTLPNIDGETICFSAKKVIYCTARNRSHIICN